MRLENKTAIVTGASSGMGKAIATLFVKEGAKVLAVARRLDKLEEIAAALSGYPGEFVPFEADMADKLQVEGMVDEAIKRFGRLDVLVNNAGIMDDFSPIGDFTDDMFDKVMKVNMAAPAYAMRKAVKAFEKQGGGVIVNTSSASGLYGCRAGAIYTASKHALVGFTKNTAYMYAAKNIRCNAICPGAIKTEIASGEFMKSVNQAGMERARKGFGLYDRIGEAEEVAEVVLFLASDESSYINGQTISVDGGWSSY